MVRPLTGAGGSGSGKVAMAALPLYVHLPKFYGGHLGVSLTALGVLLLVLRLVDGLIDPLLGAWSDRPALRAAHNRFQMPEAGAARRRPP